MIIERGRVSEPVFVIEEVTDPVECARAREQHERFKRNTDWLQANWDKVLPQALGKHLAVAGQEAFIADTAEQAWALAEAAHPDDTGMWVHYVIPEKGPRIYAHRWRVASVQ